MTWQIIWIVLFSLGFFFEIIWLHVKKVNLLSGVFIFPIAIYWSLHFNSIYLKGGASVTQQPIFSGFIFLDLFLIILCSKYMNKYWVLSLISCAIGLIILYIFLLIIYVLNTNSHVMYPLQLLVLTFVVALFSFDN